MKKQIITITILILIFLASYVHFELNYPKDMREWRIIDEWSGYIYNGTRYHAKNLTSIFIEEDNERFKLDFRITFDGYSDKIYLNSSKPENNKIVKSFFIKNSSGIYNIERLLIERPS